MSETMLRRLVGVALVDRDFCEGLMNGKQAALLEEFDLSDEEREVMASFEKGSIRDLANTVHTWLMEQGRAATSHVGGAPVHVL